MNYTLQLAKKRGYNTLQLLLLYPRNFQHDFKYFLKNWYLKFGFKIISQVKIEDRPDYPDWKPMLNRLLLTPIDIIEMKMKI